MGGRMPPEDDNYRVPQSSLQSEPSGYRRFNSFGIFPTNSDDEEFDVPVFVASDGEDLTFPSRIPSDVGEGFVDLANRLEGFDESPPPYSMYRSYGRLLSSSLDKSGVEVEEVRLDKIQVPEDVKPSKSSVLKRSFEDVELDMNGETFKVEFGSGILCGLESGTDIKVDEDLYSNRDLVEYLSHPLMDNITSFDDIIFIEAPTDGYESDVVDDGPLFFSDNEEKFTAWEKEGVFRGDYYKPGDSYDGDSEGHKKADFFMFGEGNDSIVVPFGENIRNNFYMSFSRETGIHTSLLSDSKSRLEYPFLPGEILDMGNSLDEATVYVEVSPETGEVLPEEDSNIPEPGVTKRLGSLTKAGIDIDGDHIELNPPTLFGLTAGYIDTVEGRIDGADYRKDATFY